MMLGRIVVPGTPYVIVDVEGQGVLSGYGTNYRSGRSGLPTPLVTTGSNRQKRSSA